MSLKTRLDKLLSQPGAGRCPACRDRPAVVVNYDEYTQAPGVEAPWQDPSPCGRCGWKPRAFLVTYVQAKYPDGRPAPPPADLTRARDTEAEAEAEAAAEAASVAAPPPTPTAESVVGARPPPPSPPSPPPMPSPPPQQAGPRLVHGVLVNADGSPYRPAREQAPAQQEPAGMTPFGDRLRAARAARGLW